MRRIVASVVALIAGAALTVPGLALAHSELVSSTPPADAVLTAPPAEIVLEFSEELDPAGSSATAWVGGVAVCSATVDLTVADRNVLRGPCSGSGLGTYTVTWTSLATDGDSLAGAYTFAAGEIGDAATAPQRSSWPLTALLVPVLASLGLAARRARVGEPGS